MIPEILLLAQELWVPDEENPDAGTRHMLGIVAVAFHIDASVNKQLGYSRASAMEFEYRKNHQRYHLVADGEGGKKRITEKPASGPPVRAKSLTEVIAALKIDYDQLAEKAVDPTSLLS